MGAATRALCMVLVVGWAVASQPAAGQSRYAVVALRVEFQPDTTRFTTGDGTFDGLRWPSGLQPRVDPLPHDAAHFEAHLAFLEDYVHSVSGGHATLRTHLVPHVIRLAQPMGAYSPVGPDADTDAQRNKLAQLIAEAWPRAGAMHPPQVHDLDPDRTFFVIFHAGVGRDVELLGTVLEKTPLDLPSLYFSKAALTHLGVTDLRYGTLPVTNSAIVPRTESRLGYNSITGDSLLLELSINGLLASSFFSFLGVPDLFNTETGESAIGGFGLMDPQGIFAYAGLLPPAPTAWTRQHLGWLEPVLLQGRGPLQVTLPAGAAARANISSSEYFLVENRQRDAGGDGLVLRIWKQGEVIRQHIPAISDDFSRYRVDAFVGGVVVGADDYDFALPGRDASGEQYPGGILIWHVDERVMATGQANDDPLHRGLDLEEADAAQDLGYGNTPGTPFDFFYEGNDVRAQLPSGRHIRFYENRFTPSTLPSSAANDGGASFIALTDFSAPGPEMTFTYAQEAVHGIVPQADVVLGTHAGYGSSVGGGTGFSFVFIPDAPGRAFIITPDTTAAVTSLVRPVARGRTIMVLQQQDDTYVLRRLRSPDFRVMEVHTLPLPRPRYVPRGSLLLSDQDAVHALFASETESVLVTVYADGAVEQQSLPAGGMHLALAPDGLVVVGATYAAMARGDMRWILEQGGKGAVFANGAQGLWGVRVHPPTMALHLLDADLQVHTISLKAYGAPEPLSDHVTLADLDADGMHEIITTAGDHLFAFEHAGAMVSGFPVQLGGRLSGQPLVMTTRDGHARIVVAATNGLVHAVEQGRAVPGFPLSVGASLPGTPRLSAGHLEVVTSEGVFRTYAIAAGGRRLWGEENQSSANTNMAAPVTGTTSPADRRLLIASETYNWPNPVRNGVTFLRLMTREDATIAITVLDMAGTVVHEVALDMRGGSPAEYRWDANVESGLYFARIKARSMQGRTDTRLVKVAVIR